MLFKVTSKHAPNPGAGNKYSIYFENAEPQTSMQMQAPKEVASQFDVGENYELTFTKVDE